MQHIGLFCSSSNALDASFYAAAEQLGAWIGRHGKTLVYGGANCGLMEATAKAVSEAGGRVVGVTPQILIDRDRVSAYIDEQIVTRDLNDRKQEMIDRSDVIIAMPGSLGTLDEVFTVMSANTIGIHDKRVVFWNINGFWDSLFCLFKELERSGAVNKPFDQVLVCANSFDELVALMQA